MNPAVLLPLAAAWAPAQPALPPDLAELLARIPQVAQGGRGVGSEEQALARRIQAFGSAAVPPVLALLEDGNPRVRAFAGYLLRDLPGLPESALDALIRARKAGDGWIPPAIGSIGTPRAIAFLVEDLGARPEAHTQVTGALAKAGAKAAPGLARLLRRPEGPPEQLGWALATVFSAMEDKGACAVPPLAQVAEDRDSHPGNRILALQLLAGIGKPSAAALPALRRLARAEAPDLARAAEEAILATGTADALPGLVAALDSDSGWLTALGRLASMGSAASSVGPRVAALLEKPDWERRVEAVRTLGFLGWREAVPSLRRQLDRTEDWRAASAACLALGRLRALEALPDLERVARAYWYPPVRQAAALALAVLRRERPDPGPEAWEDLLDSLPAPRPEADPGPPELVRAEEGDLGPKDLEALAYVLPGEGEEVPPQVQVPDLGMRLGAGFLLGSDQGEWGGELVYREGEKQVILLRDNIRGLHGLGAFRVVVAGLSHMGVDRGCLSRIGPGRPPRAEPWIILPGAPWRSGLLPNGNLHVQCQKGYLEITPSGEIRFTASGRR